MIFVLDASVIIKWYVEEGEQNLEKSDRILKLLEDGRIGLVEPDLVWMEIANVLSVSKKWRTEQVRIGLSRLEELNLRMIRAEGKLVGDAVEYSQQYQISVYDGIYLAVAKNAGGKLISDNTKHHGKIKDGSVILLKDFVG